MMFISDRELFREAQRLALSRAAWRHAAAKGGRLFHTAARCREFARDEERRILGLAKAAEARAALEAMSTAA